MTKSFLPKRKVSEDLSLQITSMADIFMILLVFLLKNYSTTLTNISPVQGTRLPVAHSDTALKDTLKVEISKDSILIDQKPIISLNNFQIAQAEGSEET